MSGPLHNVRINPPAPKRSTSGLFRTISRTDGKTALPQRTERPRRRRSAPRKCPICGSSRDDKPGLFVQLGELYKCTVCDSQIRQNGSVATNGVI